MEAGLMDGPDAGSLQTNSDPQRPTLGGEHLSVNFVRVSLSLSLSLSLFLLVAVPLSVCLCCSSRSAGASVWIVDETRNCV